MKKNRTEKMVKNVFLFFVASFGTKFLSFFLVPFYTSLLTTEEYGTADLLNTIVSLILPVLMLDISDAIMYFSFQTDDIEDKRQPFKFGMQILKGSGVVLLFIVCGIAFVMNDTNLTYYCAYIFFYYIGSSFNLNMLAYMRACDYVNTIVMSSIITSAVSLGLNVVLILVLRLGIWGLLISTVAGVFAGNIYCCIKVNYLEIKRTPFKLEKERKMEMLRYSIPLIFTGLAWWANSSLDRFFISYFCGMDANGLYAVANKIPTVLTAIHSIVYQAMQLSVFSEIKSNDSKEYLKKLYNIYNFLMVAACSALILLDKPLAMFLFKGDYYIAWKYAPALVISTVLFSVSGYITIVASVLNNTKTIAVATVSGAIVNGVLNIILIPKYGLYGAVIATIVGYFLIWFILIVRAEKSLEVSFSRIKSILMYALLVLQWIILLNAEHAILGEFIVIVLLALLNLGTIKDIWKLGIKVLKSLLEKVKNR